MSSATATLMRVACCALLCAVVPAAADARDKGHAHHPPVPAVAAVRPPEAPPPAGYEKVDHEVIIGTVPGQMKFDVELFRVQPGAKVKLVLKNTDEMQHNLLVCRPGESVTLEIAKAAWSLGAQAIDRQFVPDSPLVLHHTAIVNPRESDTLYFTAPREEADYPYVCTLPGHAFTMTGVMRVGKGSKAVQREAVRKALRGREDEWYHVLVTDRPRLVRCVMPDSSARSIAVGLPGGINYCFDAEGAYVRYGWFGPFLDAGPDRGRGGTRGGGANVPLGERFSAGMSGFPLRLGESGEAPAVQFQGYQLGQVPVFLYTVDGHAVRHTITAADRGIGLTHTFEIAAAAAGSVRFIADAAGVSVACEAGEVNGGTVTIRPDKARKFTVTIVEAR